MSISSSAFIDLCKSVFEPHSQFAALMKVFGDPSHRKKSATSAAAESMKLAMNHLYDALLCRSDEERSRKLSASEGIAFLILSSSLQDSTSGYREAYALLLLGAANHARAEFKVSAAYVARAFEAEPKLCRTILPDVFETAFRESCKEAYRLLKEDNEKAFQNKSRLAGPAMMFGAILVGGAVAVGGAVVLVPLLGKGANFAIRRAVVSTAEPLWRAGRQREKIRVHLKRRYIRFNESVNVAIRGCAKMYVLALMDDVTR